MTTKELRNMWDQIRERWVDITLSSGYTAKEVLVSGLTDEYIIGANEKKYHIRYIKKIKFSPLK